MGDPMSVQDDLVRNYEGAKQLVEALEAEWIALDRPLVRHDGGATGRSMVEHPLVKMLQVARRDVDRLAKGVASAERGRPQVAKVQASVGASPSAQRRLKVAK